MRRQLSQKSVWMLFLLLLLTASLLLVSCGVQGVTGSGPTNNASTPLTHLPKGTLRFTASGGMNGTYTFTDIGVAYIQQQGLILGAQDSAWSFLMHVHGYTGPGTYSVIIPKTSGYSGTDNSLHVLYSSGSQLLSWTLTAFTACQVVVASDVPLGTMLGDPIHHVKGAFSCPNLATTGEYPPLALSDGQFDVPADVCDTSTNLCHVYVLPSPTP